MRRAALSGGAEAVLCRYRPDERQSRHSHSVHELTVLLAGDLGETVGPREYDCAAGWAAFKPAGVDHTDTWGRRGALIFSLKVEGDAIPATAAEPGWRPLAGRTHLALLRACLAADLTAPEAVADLLAAFTLSPEPCGAPPLWLARAHERLRAEPDRVGVGQIAAASGVSRTHFSAAFQQHYGRAPSVFRRDAMAAEALRLALDERCGFAQAAADAGFADQSHMSRTVRGMTGLSPSSVRRALSP